jgi:hypothetical protein
MKRPRPPHPWRDLPCAADDLFEFTGALLRGDIDRVVRQLKSPERAIDVLVARHRLGPMLASANAGTDWFAALPQETRDRIYAMRDRQVNVAGRCLTLLDEIDAACRTESLPFLVVKGPSMALRFYGGVAARGYWDLDVMVRERDRRRMESLLTRIGAICLSRKPLGGAVSAWLNHSFDYERNGIKLDLHWCMSRLPAVRCDGDAAFARAEAMDLAGRAVRVLSAADELHFVLISAFADIQRGYLRMQSLIDAWRLLLLMPPNAWPGFFALRRTERTDRMCRETLKVLLASLKLADEVPALASALGGCPSTERARDVLRSSLAGWRGKAWGARSLPATLPHYAAWWTLSLPFRVAASHPAWRRRG